MISEIYLVVRLCLLLPLVSSQFPFSTNKSPHPYPPASLHYVKIGRKLDGDYQFGYDTGKGPLGQSFREEVRLADGTVQGTYGLVDEQGQKRVVHYTAGKSGFLAQEDSESIEKPTFSTSLSQPRFLDRPISTPSTVKPSRYQQTKTSLYKKPYYSKRIPQTREQDAHISQPKTLSKNEMSYQPEVRPSSDFGYKQALVSEPMLPLKQTKIQKVPSKQSRPATSNDYSQRQELEQILPLRDISSYKKVPVKQSIPTTRYEYSQRQVSEPVTAYKMSDFQEVTENKLVSELRATNNFNYNSRQVSRPMLKPSSYLPAKDIMAGHNYNPHQEPMSSYKMPEDPENEPGSMRQLSLEVYEMKTPGQQQQSHPSAIEKEVERDEVVRPYKRHQQVRNDDVPSTPISQGELYQVKTTAAPFNSVKEHSFEIYRVQNEGLGNSRTEETVLEPYRRLKGVKQDLSLQRFSPYRQPGYQRAQTVPTVEKEQNERSMYQAPQQPEYEIIESIEEPKERKTLLKTYRSRQEQKKSKAGRQSNKKTQKKEMMSKPRIYDPKIEDEYYDTEPAFIDIERLSYNIGTTKNSGRSFY